MNTGHAISWQNLAHIILLPLMYFNHHLPKLEKYRVSHYICLLICHNLFRKLKKQEKKVDQTTLQNPS